MVEKHSGLVHCGLARGACAQTSFISCTACGSRQTAPFQLACPFPPGKLKHCYRACSALILQLSSPGRKMDEDIVVAPSVPLGINLVVVDSDASMLGDESGDTDSEEAQLFTEMIVKLSAAAAPDPVRKMLLAAKAEELTRTNKAREARAARQGRTGPLQPASASQLNRHNREEVVNYTYNNGNAARFRRGSRAASSSSLCLTIRLTEMNIKRYVENVIRRSVMEGRSPRCL